jgi:polyisoprenoid-binding protein YceI
MPFQRLNFLLAAALCSMPGGLRGALLVVDKHESRIQIQVKATLSSFVARLPDYDAAITVASASGRVESVQFNANFDGVKTGLTARDADMNEWQETDQFPRLRFVLTSLQPGERGTYLARGLLLLHGVQEAISFPVAITTDRRLLAVDGELAVDTRDFGLPIIRKFFFLTVNPVVHLRFHLQGNLTQI